MRILLEGPRRPRVDSIVSTVVVALLVVTVPPPGVSSAAIVGYSRPISRGGFGGRRGGPRRPSSSLVVPALVVRGGEMDEKKRKKKATTSKKGGADDGGGEKRGGTKGKKRRKKRGDEEGTTKAEDDGGETEKGRGDDGKRAIDDAMRGTDAAQALGDAIRERRDILLSDPPDGDGEAGDTPPITVVDSSLASLGLSLGTSDATLTPTSGTVGGVAEVATRATDRTVADYFLRGGHGGAYAAQSAASALAVGCGAGCLAMLVAHKRSASRSLLPLVLLRRCLLAAMAKHASGLFAAALVSARAIPTDGLRRTRARLEGLVLDPVAQYLCYSALLLVWTGAGGAVPIAGGKEGEGAPWPWWMGRWYLVSCLLGPILLREVVHVAWVLSDVAVISAGGEANFLVSAATGVVDVVMSVLSGADRWRVADAAGRQRILAKLVGRASLVMELVTGLIIALDALRALANYSLAPPDSASRPPIRSVLTRLLCTRLYVNFLVVRRRKIKRLVTDLRGGASAAPVAILDALLEPRRAMGLSYSTSSSVASKTADASREDERGSRREKGWIGLAVEGLGF